MDQAVKILRSAGLALSRSLDLDEVLQTLLDTIGRLVPFDSACVMLREGETNLVVRATRGYEHWSESPQMVGVTFDARTNPIIEALLSARQSVLVGDTLAHPGWQRKAGGEHVRCWMGVPLVAGQELIGLYSVDRAVPRSFTEEDLRLTESLSAPAAVAIQNARLFEQLKRSEGRYRESEERFRALVENSTEGIVLLGADGTNLYRSAPADRIVGYASEELEGRSIAELMHPEDSPRIAALFQDCLTKPGVATPAEFRLQHKDGSWRTVEAVAVNHLNDPNVAAVVVNYRDITESRRLEEELRHAQKMEAVGCLAGGIAHDFNNLLTAILGYASLALRRLGEGDPLRRNLEEIRRAGEQGAGLTRQLLAFSRKQVLRPEVLDLNALVRSLNDMLGRLIAEDIRLITVLHPEPARTEADPGQIEQVILNLVINARDAMPCGGTLTIEVQALELPERHCLEHPDVSPGRHVMLAVSDTGVGMSPETQARIFDPFFTTKELGKGTGLGLATVYGIVKQSGGHIVVDSQLAQGTDFKIYLPAAKTQGEDAESPGDDVPPRGNETVPLVEGRDAHPGADAADPREPRALRP